MSISRNARARGLACNRAKAWQYQGPLRKKRLNALLFELWCVSNSESIERVYISSVGLRGQVRGGIDSVFGVRQSKRGIFVLLRAQDKLSSPMGEACKDTSGSLWLSTLFVRLALEM